MSPLKLRPGPFLAPTRPGPEAITALTLVPWFVFLVAVGFFWPPLSPLVSLAALGLAKSSQGSQGHPGSQGPKGHEGPKPWAFVALHSALAAVAIGPGAGPGAYLAAGLLTAVLALNWPIFRHPFLPAAACGLLVEFSLRRWAFLGYDLPAGPADGPLSASPWLAEPRLAIAWLAQPGIVGSWLAGACLILLLPSALASLLTGRQRIRFALLPLAVWLAFEVCRLALGRESLDWSLGPLWLCLAFQLGREFWPSNRAWPGPALVALAGLFLALTLASSGATAAALGLVMAPYPEIVWGPPFAPNLVPVGAALALAFLSVCEMVVGLAGRRRGKILASIVPRPEAPPENPDLVALRLCGKADGFKASVYRGPPGCRLAAALDGGPEDCPEGCLTFGDCAAGCPHGAITSLGPGRPPKIDKARCRGCGACLAVCPKNLLALRPREASFAVLCRGSAKLKDMDALCPVGCLKCGRCRKACPAGAIERLGALAPPTVSDPLCRKARPDCGLACRPACPRSLPGPAMGRF